MTSLHDLKINKRIEKVHIVYTLLAIYFIFQTIEFVQHSPFFENNYRKIIIDTAMLGVTAMSLVCIGYFMLEKEE